MSKILHIHCCPILCLVCLFSVSLTLTAAEHTLNATPFISDPPQPINRGDWRPGCETIYWWSDGTNEWYNPQYTNFTYDEFGRVTSSYTKWTKYTYDYNENGLPYLISSYIVGKENPGGIEETIFDPIVHNYPIKYIKRQFNSNTGECIYESVTGNEITRDDNNHVIKVQSYFITAEGEKKYADIYHGIEYGSDGKASHIYEFYTYDNSVTWEMTDIEWERTDGQILDFDIDIDICGFFTGNNRIHTGKLTIYDDYQNPVLDIKASYTTDVTHIEAKRSNELYASLDFVVLNENGSFEKDKFYTYTEFYQSTQSYVTKTVRQHEVHRYDSFGLEIFHAWEEYEDDEITWEGIEEADIVYDQEFGYPTEYTWNDVLHLYTEYVYVTSDIPLIGTDNTDLETEYYNLQGINVSPSNIRPGIYIIRQGKEVSKIVVK